ncbi:hypothetical protein J6590_048024 [Homalodisca vitripennis]|nr:hypothetical protein J6590_048024 [Homalodisca vitripennis]
MGGGGAMQLPEGRGRLGETPSLTYPEANNGVETLHWGRRGAVTNWKHNLSGPLGRVPLVTSIMCCVVAETLSPFTGSGNNNLSLLTSSRMTDHPHHARRIIHI